MNIQKLILYLLVLFCGANGSIAKKNAAIAKTKIIEEQREVENNIRGGGGANNNNDSRKNNNKYPSMNIGVDVDGRSVLMPLIGAGTWQYNDTIAYQSVCKALSEGYKMIDTAFGYGNEKGIGRAIKDCFIGPREDLFILTKIPGGLSKEQVHAASVQNLMLLDVDYVDHLMTHYPSDWDQKFASKERRQEEWIELEEIYYSGKARSIGISHYCSKHIDDILSVASVRPSLNQVEYHIGSGDVDHIIDKCTKENITFMSFSPLCGPCQYTNKTEESLIYGDLVAEIGSHYNKTGSQVSLRYIVQQSLSGEKNIGGVIPKSNEINHIRSNADIFDFEINKQDMKRLKRATTPSGETGDCEVI